MVQKDLSAVNSAIKDASIIDNVLYVKRVDNQIVSYQLPNVVPNWGETDTNSLEYILNKHTIDDRGSGNVRYDVSYHADGTVTVQDEIGNELVVSDALKNKTGFSFERFKKGRFYRKDSVVSYGIGYYVSLEDNFGDRYPTNDKDKWKKVILYDAFKKACESHESGMHALVYALDSESETTVQIKDLWDFYFYGSVEGVEPFALKNFIESEVDGEFIAAPSRNESNIVISFKSNRIRKISSGTINFEAMYRSYWDTDVDTTIELLDGEVSVFSYIVNSSGYTVDSKTDSNTGKYSKDFDTEETATLTDSNFVFSFSDQSVSELRITIPRRVDGYIPPCFKLSGIEIEYN